MDCTSRVATDIDVPVVGDLHSYYRAEPTGCFVCSLFTGTLGTLSGLLAHPDMKLEGTNAVIIPTYGV